MVMGDFLNDIILTAKTVMEEVRTRVDVINIEGMIAGKAEVFSKENNSREQLL